MTALSNTDISARAAAKPYVAPRYVIPLLAVTIPYLLLEMSFSARLLDLASGLASAEEVHAVERWGYALSGIALALAIVGAVICPLATRLRWNPAAGAFWILLATGGSLALTWTQEKALVDDLADRAPASLRQAAARLAVVGDALRRGQTQIAGLEGLDAVLDRPEGKAYLALYAAVTLADPKVSERTRPWLEPSARQAIEARIGAPERLFDAAFIPSILAIRDAFKRYQKGSADYDKAIAGAEDEADRSWAEYLKRLKSRGYTPGGVPSYGFNEVRQQVRSMGVPVPDAWVPTNKSLFRKTVLDGIRKRADAAWDTAIRDALGGSVSLPHGLDWAGFWAHAAVQKRWRGALLQDDTRHERVVLSPHYAFQDYKRRVYDPVVEDLLRDELKRLAAPANTYATDGGNGDYGHDAMRALLVPPVALTFSIAGMLLHLWKSCGYLTRLGASRLRLPTVVAWPLPPMTASVIIFALVVIFDSRTTAITAAPGWTVAEANTAAAFGERYGRAARWLVQAESAVYPLNDAIRRTVFLGIEFGYAKTVFPEKPNESTPEDREVKALL